MKANIGIIAGGAISAGVHMAAGTTSAISATTGGALITAIGGQTAIIGTIERRGCEGLRRFFTNPPR
ncbi:MAG: hypothetical protein WBX25_07885 [Rhodomicrobium sp.]